jgi:hypothetical protein
LRRCVLLSLSVAGRRRRVTSHVEHRGVPFTRHVRFAVALVPIAVIGCVTYTAAVRLRRCGEAKVSLCAVRGPYECGRSTAGLVSARNNSAVAAGSWRDRLATSGRLVVRSRPAVPQRQRARGGQHDEWQFGQETQADQAVGRHRRDAHQHDWRQQDEEGYAAAAQRPRADDCQLAAPPWSRGPRRRKPALGAGFRASG